ncbi:cysteine hydrolase [Nocardia sp. NBC_00881]|uniref:cysteine hydrolase n=1 Tax=Nocardia sp. NBC_00881 TaxID=2975995 RepID=UPI003865ED40|nr:cysteine hydrolase [Nocardia sp. NBC_00881]
MRHANGLSIPQSLSDACDPARMALLIYDMQVGIVRQIPGGDKVVQTCVRLRDAARIGGFRVFYTRHMSLPIAASGVSQLRTAMSWQRVDDPTALRSSFPQGSPQYQLVPDLAPGPDEVVFDKITMSAFAATPLDFALRDCHIDTFAVAGIAMEVGIEPTVRHSLDLGYLPVVVADACGAGHPSAAERSHATLEFAGGTLTADTAALVDLMSSRSD